MKMTRKQMVLLAGAVGAVGLLLAEYLPEHEGWISALVKGVVAALGQ